MGGGSLRPIRSNIKYSGVRMRKPQIPATQNTIFANLIVSSRSSTDGFAVEIAEADGEEQHVEEHQPEDYRHQGQMRELGNHRGAKAFAGVNEGIYEDGFLQDGEFVERAPGIVGAAKKNHGGHDEAEHQAD